MMTLQSIARHRILLGLLACVLAIGPTLAKADVWVRVPDASQIYYQTAPDNRIYIRNANSFDSRALGCCYNYAIDLNTLEGRAIFTALLAAAAQETPFWFAVPDG